MAANTLDDPDAALAFAGDFIRERFGQSQVEGDTVFFWYREGAIPLSGYLQLSQTLNAALLRISTAVPVEKAYRAAAAEYVARVNYVLRVGGWALSFDDGDIRWMSGFYFDAAGPTREGLVTLFESSITLARMHLPGVVKITVGRSVDDALRANEQGDVC